MLTLLICRSCCASREHVGESVFSHQLEIALKTARLPRPFQVEAIQCMGSCEKPIAVALQGKGMASYVFSGINGTEDIPDLVETCRLYAESHLGWIEDAHRCGRMRHLLRARLPAIN